MAKQYFVGTWDTDLQEFTEQEGVPRGPYTLWELRGALRALRKMGYSARKGDPAVSVCGEDEVVK